MSRQCRRKSGAHNNTQENYIQMIICVVCDVLGKENNGTTIAAMNLIRSLR